MKLQNKMKRNQRNLNACLIFAAVTQHVNIDGNRNFVMFFSQPFKESPYHNFFNKEYVFVKKIM